jgi:hypothetical protein
MSYFTIPPPVAAMLLQPSLHNSCSEQRWRPPPAGLASSPWSFRPAGGSALANVDQLPPQGASGGAQVHVGWKIGRNFPFRAPVFKQLVKSHSTIAKIPGLPPPNFVPTSLSLSAVHQPGPGL